MSGLQVSESDILGALVRCQRVLGGFLATRTCEKGLGGGGEGEGGGGGDRWRTQRGSANSRPSS